VLRPSSSMAGRGLRHAKPAIQEALGGSTHFHSCGSRRYPEETPANFRRRRFLEIDKLHMEAWPRDRIRRDGRTRHPSNEESHTRRVLLMRCQHDVARRGGAVNGRDDRIVAVGQPRRNCHHDLV